MKFNCCTCSLRLFRFEYLFSSKNNNSLVEQENTAQLHKKQSCTMTAQMASFLKLTLVGDGGVGKSCLILQYMYGDVSFLL